MKHFSKFLRFSLQFTVFFIFLMSVVSFEKLQAQKVLGASVVYNPPNPILCASNIENLQTSEELPTEEMVAKVVSYASGGILGPLNEILRETGEASAGRNPPQVIALGLGESHISVPERKGVLLPTLSLGGVRGLVDDQREAKEVEVTVPLGLHAHFLEQEPHLTLLQINAGLNFNVRGVNSENDETLQLIKSRLELLQNRFCPPGVNNDYCGVLRTLVRSVRQPTTSLKTFHQRFSRAIHQLTVHLDELQEQAGKSLVFSENSELKIYKRASSHGSTTYGIFLDWTNPHYDESTIKGDDIKSFFEKTPVDLVKRFNDSNVSLLSLMSFVRGVGLKIEISDHGEIQHSIEINLVTESQEVFNEFVDINNSIREYYGDFVANGESFVPGNLADIINTLATAILAGEGVVPEGDSPNLGYFSMLQVYLEMIKQMASNGL